MKSFQTHKMFTQMNKKAEVGFEKLYLTIFELVFLAFVLLALLYYVNNAPNSMKKNFASQELALMLDAAYTSDKNAEASFTYKYEFTPRIHETNSRVEIFEKGDIIASSYRLVSDKRKALEIEDNEEEKSILITIKKGNGKSISAESAEQLNSGKTTESEKKETKRTKTVQDFLEPETKLAVADVNLEELVFFTAEKHQDYTINFKIQEKDEKFKETFQLKTKEIAEFLGPLLVKSKYSKKEISIVVNTFVVGGKKNIFYATTISDNNIGDIIYINPSLFELPPHLMQHVFSHEFAHLLYINKDLGKNKNLKSLIDKAKKENLYVVADTYSVYPPSAPREDLGFFSAKEDIGIIGITITSESEPFAHYYEFISQHSAEYLAEVEKLDGSRKKLAQDIYNEIKKIGGL